MHNISYIITSAAFDVKNKYNAIFSTIKMLLCRCNDNVVINVIITEQIIGRRAVEDLV
jgi:hypothetical protein